MPMKTAKMHGGGKKSNPYCIYCTDVKGKLKTRVQVKAGMTIFFMKYKKMEKKEAEKFAEAYMRRMPAWKRKPKKKTKKKAKKKPKKRTRKRRRR